MPGGIGVPEWVVIHIAVAVQVLRVTWIGHERVGADEACEDRVVIARFVEIESSTAIQFLARVLVGHIHRRARHIGPNSAIGIIGDGFHLGAGAIRHHAGRAEMVGVIVVDRATRGNRGDALVPGKDEARAGGVVAFVDLPDIPRRGGAHDLLHPPPLLVTRTWLIPLQQTSGFVGVPMIMLRIVDVKT